MNNARYTFSLIAGTPSVVEAAGKNPKIGIPRALMSFWSSGILRGEKEFIGIDNFGGHSSVFADLQNVHLT